MYFRKGFPSGSVVKNPPAMQGLKNPPTVQLRRYRFNPWVRKIPWRRTWQPILVFLPGVSHGQRNLVGYNP